MSHPAVLIATAAALVLCACASSNDNPRDWTQTGSTSFDQARDECMATAGYRTMDDRFEACMAVKGWVRKAD